MKLIDADAFERNMQNEWENNEISNGEWIHFREMLNQEPTVDAVEVVRCKDCMYYEESLYDVFTNHDMVCAYAPLHHFYREPNDYCSKGRSRNE